MTNKIKFGIVGPGMIANFHAKAIKHSSNAEVTAILGRNQEKTEDFASEQSIKAYTDAADFFQSGDFDAITIGTPSGAHLEVAEMAAKAGKHILCEKPLEVTPEKIQRMIDICAENNVYLGAIFQSRFSEGALLAKKAIEGGRLGKILLASCQMRWYRPQEYYDSAAWRGTWALDGGGCLMNQGIHTIDLLLFLAGDPQEVYAYTSTRTHESIEVEDNGCAVVKFKNGAIGFIEGSTSCNPGFPRKIEISGEMGTIIMGDSSLEKWEMVEKTEEDEKIIADISQNAGGSGGSSDPKAIDFNGHRKQVEDFASAILDKKEPAVSGIEGKRAVSLICAIYESAKTGGPIKF